VALGEVERETLGELIRDQIREAAADFFLSVGGDLEYHDRPDEFSTVGIGEMDIMRVVLEGARRLDERGIRTTT